MQLTISQITEYTRALTIVPARDPQTTIHKLCWDSRKLQPGMLFIALAGEVTDGNNYIIQAFEQGAAAVIATRETTQEQRAVAQRHRAALLYAPNGVVALQRLATEYRAMLDIKVIGITGSSGKTSTKQFVAAVMQKAYITVSSVGNQNNEIGLPATVLAALPITEVLVVEMAMRGLGQIAQLCEIAQPQIGIITNIGTAHLELLGSQDNIAKAKAELIYALPEGQGIAILNGDDPFTPLIQQVAQTQQRDVTVMTYGLEDHNDLQATQIIYNKDGCATFDIRGIPADYPGDGQEIPMPVQLHVPGSHSVYNALAAAAAGVCLGLTSHQIAQALEQTQAAPMRQVSHDLEDGTLLIDDTYNANPDSMKAALEVLSRLDPNRLHVAVLGDMGELGPQEALLHQQVGAMVSQTQTDVLITIGQAARGIAQGALAGGMDGACIVTCDSVEEALAALVPYRKEAPVILVKASRVMGLERVVELLMAGYQPQLASDGQEGVEATC